MQTVRGRITVTQELRFQLVDDQGRTMLFALAHGTPVEPQDLERLRRDARMIEVHYEQAPTLNSYTAEALYALDSQDALPATPQGKH